MGKFPQLFCLPSRHGGQTNFGTFGFANSIRPFSAHGSSCLKTSCHCVQKLGTNTSCGKPLRPYSADIAPSASLGQSSWEYSILNTQATSIFREGREITIAKKTSRERALAASLRSLAQQQRVAFCSMMYQARPARRCGRSMTTSWCGMAHAHWRSPRCGLMGDIGLHTGPKSSICGHRAASPVTAVPLRAQGPHRTCALSRLVTVNGLTRSRQLSPSQQGVAAETYQGNRALRRCLLGSFWSVTSCSINSMERT